MSSPPASLQSALCDQRWAHDPVQSKKAPCFCGHTDTPGSRERGGARKNPAGLRGREKLESTLTCLKARRQQPTVQEEPPFHLTRRKAYGPEILDLKTSTRFFLLEQIWAHARNPPNLNPAFLRHGDEYRDIKVMHAHSKRNLEDTIFAASEGITNKKRRKAGMSPMMLNWNKKYQKQDSEIGVFCCCPSTESVLTVIHSSVC
ncbi:uncharacterized protein LOC103671273 [Ursus maritimus]|uniref:Uncharacterized protein LOC103671273 n=1 Tax=Ursus maritimus TaxID=29073 RepID=A0A384CUD8_URSMA|nr:uncharacterized protein LOC103671273 [Ursus maritimus]XP_008698100.1 uncharacterized protein LOC103671273 [Ursus maritimus]